MTAIGTLAILAAASACRSVLEPEDVVGSYTATRLLYSGDDNGDFLAEGGSISLTLAAGGTTSGTMVVPGSLSESGDEESFDLTGTYTIVEETDVIEFDHDADTFLRDTQFEAEGNTLVANPTFGGTTLDVVLTRQ